MNEVTNYWIEKAYEAVDKKTFRVWMHGHSLDIDAILNYPKGNRLLMNFKWYREKMRDQHIHNLLMETWKHWDNNRIAIVYRHGVIE